MKRTPFNDDWRFRPKVNAFAELMGGGGQPWVPVRLPHDAMIDVEPRDQFVSCRHHGMLLGHAKPSVCDSFATAYPLVREHNPCRNTGSLPRSQTPNLGTGS